MGRRLLALIAVVTASLLASPVSHSSPRIINGADVADGQFPYVVSILGTQALDSAGAFQAQFCAGVLTTASTVVTAAHCLVDPKSGRQFSPEEILVGFGPQLTRSRLQIERIASVVIHPNYDLRTARNDIAVLNLATARPDVPVITPLRPSDQPTYVQPDTAAQVVGWGNTSPTGSAFPEWLRVGNVVLFPDASCGGGASFTVRGIQFNGFRAGEAFPGEMICAAGVTTQGRIVDSCQGDSGGPLIVGEGVAARLVGLVSWGDTCATSYPGVYTRISQMVDFLQSAGAVVSLAPTVPPGVEVTPINNGLRVTFIPANDGSLVTTFAATATDPATGAVAQCFATPRKDGLPAVCDITTLTNTISYAVQAIAANDLGNSPPTADITATPEPIPDPGRILRFTAQPDRSALIRVSRANGLGLPITDRDVTCRPVAGGAERRAAIRDGQATLRNLRRGWHACTVTAVTEAGRGSSIPQDFRIR
jgi:secreted trypsin-like serine protease